VDNFHYRPPPRAALDRRLTAADRPGEHLWVVSAAWLIADPAVPGPKLLDSENVVRFDGSRCWKCEETYNPELAARPCTGSLYDTPGN
jgi:hypothetical protein